MPYSHSHFSLKDPVTNYHAQNSFEISVLIFIFLLCARLKLQKVYLKKYILCTLTF